ncbi:hypothetical protein J5N97_013799 [Dioscorea zingiberensis]|uniref:Uncharacterized protein n=1 Tax=Dioscorea zingiberensis TaxID=325984 RepID=A0A9D5CTZ4_9LILI|nr:hypothetical protein J5N97_013799 [Dioscorea zingiberensis]
MESSGPIIGPQYTLPYPVDLAFTRKVAGVKHGKLAITDINGNVIFWLEASSWSNKKKLVDATSRQPLISMKDKCWTLHDEWQAFRGDSTKEKDLLFRVKRSSMFQIHTKLEVFLAANSEGDKCDFKIKGKYKKRKSMIYKQGDASIVLAQMSKEHKVEKVAVDKNAFGLRINPNTDFAFIVALVIVLREICQTEASQRDDAVGGVIESVTSVLTS